MLCLTRKEGQVIVIAGSIRIVVAEVSGKTVRIKIDAPREVGVVREEVLLRAEAPEKGKDL